MQCTLGAINLTMKLNAFSQLNACRWPSCQQQQWLDYLQNILHYPIHMTVTLMHPFPFCAPGADSNVEMVGENTLQKAHHRCRRKKHDMRMVDTFG